MNYRNLGLGILISAALASCKQHPPTDLTKENLIPKPVSVTATAKVFELRKETGIFIEGESAELRFAGQYLADRLNPSTGFDMKVSVITGEPKSGNIYFTIAGDDAELGDEGYEITITEDLLKVSANKPAGIFWAIQTIRQLLPAKVERDSVQEGPWEISTGTIRDYPSYSFRGSMLDVARHFFEVEDVKRYIDLIALYKMNVLHLSLSNDQGWRIEIK
jgi:hexosaminidase